MGRLEQIFIKRVHGGVMDRVTDAVLVTARGLAGSADQGGRRQVTILDLDRWNNSTAGVGREIDPGQRRANLVISGVELANTRGATLRIGTARLCINGETRPCALMDKILPGLQSALRDRWAGGAFAEVVEGAAIRVGDEVVWESADKGGLWL